MFKRTLIILFILNALTYSFASKKEPVENRLYILNSWMTEYLDITKNCVGYTPPVAARTFSYLSVGAYEAIVESDNKYMSLSGQLKGFQRTVWMGEDQDISFSHVLNYLNKELCCYYFESMPPFNLNKVEVLYTQNKKRYRKFWSEKDLKRSEEYAKLLANEIIEWSKKDNGDKGYDRNYPKSYSPPVCESCWVQTYPGYRNALLPYWGGNRLMIELDSMAFSHLKVLEYSTDTNSIIHQDSKSLVELYESFTKEQEIIAEYWNDAPGYSGTPSGHIISLGIQLSKEQKLNVLESAHLYSMLGISLNDAFVVCWKLKYQYNLIRPITYIHRLITSEYSAHIATPPFPEFPSGHSFQSSAAAQVLIAFFTDNMAFVDSTHISRVDIDGSPRSFNNFSEMAEEISISRFYGGIHFPYTLKISSEMGEVLGKNIVQKLKYLK